MNEDYQKYHVSKSYGLFVVKDIETNKNKKCKSITELAEYVKSKNIIFEDIQLTRSVSNKEQREITDKLKENLK